MQYSAFVKKIPVEKGWSGDRKYLAETATGERYLLRVSPMEREASRRRMFELQQQVAELGIPMCRPVSIGVCEEGVYTVQTWIDGVDAEDAIAAMPEPDQYRYGVEAGRILARIHTISAPAEQPDWEPRFNAKMDRKIRMYRECPIQFDGAEQMIAYIEANRSLLKNRPQTYQHGDYHVGNLMLEKGRITVIDFDRYDFGDPWEEFNRIVWCAQAAPRFASGMVDGYFEGEVPEEFWRLLALYISSNTLSSIPWAIPFGEEEVQVMQNQARDVLSWYDDMRRVIPSWYKRGTPSSVGRRVHVVIDRSLGSAHPNHPDMIYPVNYGYVPGVLAGDGEEQDAYVLGVDAPVTAFDGVVIAVLHRNDDAEEKWVVAPEGVDVSDGEILAKTHFTEQYFTTVLKRN